MEFPTDVDCIIYGTGPCESILSASLSILGRSVLQIDRNGLYGGLLSSYRFLDLTKLLESENSESSTDPLGVELSSDGSLRLFSNALLLPSFRKSQWFVTLVEDASQPSDLTSPSVVTSNEKANPSETIASAAQQDLASPDGKEEPHIWTRSELEKRLRRVEVDLLPKIVYARSPTVTALQRSDVTRYLDFRFVSRYLAYSTLPGPDNVPEEDAQITQQSRKIFQIPMGRSDLFKSRLLNLRQKRCLSLFLEGCCDSPIRDEADNEKSDGNALEAFMEYLQRDDRLDEFTRQLALTNLAWGNERTTTKTGLGRIQKLLSSMNRFGQYPLLWPVYGCGDIPQAYCRMAAVFGAVFSLECSINSIHPLETDAGDASVQPTGVAHPTFPRRLTAQLSNGHQVKATCVVLGADQLPTALTMERVTRWCARCVLLTDQSLCADGRKPFDISILAFPLPGPEHADLEPVLILEIPLDSAPGKERNLFLVHMFVATSTCLDPFQLFQSPIDQLFIKYGETVVQSNRPQVLWAGYFCLPDMSGVDGLPSDVSSSSRFTNSNGCFVCPGPDASPDLDLTVAAAEALFQNMACQLGLQRVQSAAGRSDEPQPSGVTDSNHLTDMQYLSLDDRWDGVFPPKPPRPEELVIQD